MQPLPGDLPADEPAANQLDLKTLVVYGIGRSRFLVALVVLVVAGLALVAAVAMPNNYSSTASLRFTPGLREQRMAPEVSLGMDVRAVAPSIVEEILLLDDPVVFRRVAERYGAERILIPADPGQYDTPSTGSVVRGLHGFQRWLLELRGPAEFEGNTELALDAAAKLLRARTAFTPMPRSTVIQVTHTSSSKERSVEILDFILEACVERHRERYGIEEEFARSQAREADLFSQLQAAKQRFREYRTECGVDDVDKARDRVNERISEIESQIAELEAAIGAGDAELEFLRTLADSLEPEIEEIVPAVRAPNPRYQSLVEDRERAAIDLEVLNSDESMTFDEKARQKRTLEARIAKYDQRLEEVEPFVDQRPEARTVRANPDWVETQRQIQQLEGMQQARSRRLVTLGVDRDEQLSELEHVRGCEETHTLLSESIDEFREDYDAITARNEQLADLSRLDESGAANLSRYIEPRTPDSKDGPPRGKIVLGGLAGGIFLGIALAILRQLLDPRVRYPRTVERQLGLRVLCTVPEERAWKRLRNLEPAS